MDYAGPHASDYDNIRHLNAGFLALPGLRAGGSLAASLPAPAAEKLLRLGKASRRRLADVPLLLFAFREQPADLWSGAPLPPGDLFDHPPPPEEVTLTAAALGFTWQLARSNPYAARLTCGGSLRFCELIAERPLYEVIRLALSVRLIDPRRADDAGLWSLLLDGGIAGDRKVREATHLAVLQRVLMSRRANPVLASRAANALPRPAQRQPEATRR